MQYKLWLLVFGAISVLLAGFSEGATTTTKKPEPVNKKKLPAPAKSSLVGGHTPWDTKIKPNHQKIFDDYKNITSKKLQEIHKVPASFVPKPHKFATQTVGGINYLYLVKLPSNKYAFVSIHHRAWSKDHYGKEENVLVRAQTYALNDKTV